MIRYSQNDHTWKNEKIGQSNLSLGAYGCVTADIATAASWFGDNLTPRDLAKHKELYTSGGLMIWSKLDGILKHMKFLYRYYSFDKKIANDALIYDPNKCVLFRVDRGYHWVMALRKTSNGYICHDPYPFPAKEREYTFSEIDGMATFKRNHIIFIPSCSHCCPLHCK